MKKIFKNVVCCSTVVIGALRVKADTHQTLLMHLSKAGFQKTAVPHVYFFTWTYIILPNDFVNFTSARSSSPPTGIKTRIKLWISFSRCFVVRWHVCQLDYIPCMIIYDMADVNMVAVVFFIIIILVLRCFPCGSAERTYPYLHTPSTEVRPLLQFQKSYSNIYIAIPFAYFQTDLSVRLPLPFRQI